MNIEINIQCPKCWVYMEYEDELEKYGRFKCPECKLEIEIEYDFKQAIK